MFLYISTKTFWISAIFCGGHPCHPQKAIKPWAPWWSKQSPGHLWRHQTRHGRVARCRLADFADFGHETPRPKKGKIDLSHLLFVLDAIWCCFFGMSFSMFIFWILYFVWIWFIYYLFKDFFGSVICFFPNLGVSKKNINHMVGYSHVQKRCLPAVLLKRFDVSLGGCQWMSLAKGCQAALRSGVQYWRLRPFFSGTKNSAGPFLPNYRDQIFHQKSDMTTTAFLNQRGWIQPGLRDCGLWPGAHGGFMWRFLVFFLKGYLLTYFIV